MSKADSMRAERLRALASNKDPIEREALRQELKVDDMREVLSTAAGKRVFGSIFDYCGLNDTTLSVHDHAFLSYKAGVRDAGNVIANSVREADPRAVAECEIAHAEFERLFEELANDEGEEE